MTTFLECSLLQMSPEAPLKPAQTISLLSDALQGRDSSHNHVLDVNLDGFSAKAFIPHGKKMPTAAAPIACAIGAFDGVHRGHQALIDRLLTRAQELKAAPLIVTFSPDPAEVLSSVTDGIELLSVSERIQLLSTCASVPIIVLHFTPELAQVSYDVFVRDVLQRLGTLRLLVVGENFQMGAKGAGTVSALSELGAQDGFEVIGLHLVDDNGSAVSATRIRSLIPVGRVEQAAGMLGRCYRVEGKIIHGRGEGKTFGFPTANVSLSARSCLPKQGVFAGFVVCRSHAWPAALNVGLPPTFTDTPATSQAFLEANLLGFSGDLYNRDVTVVFVRWLRDSRPFSSVEELKKVVLSNIDWVRMTLGEHEVNLGGTNDL